MNKAAVKKLMVLVNFMENLPAKLRNDDYSFNMNTWCDAEDKKPKNVADLHKCGRVWSGIDPVRMDHPRT